MPLKSVIMTYYDLQVWKRMMTTLDLRGIDSNAHHDDILFQYFCLLCSLVFIFFKKFIYLRERVSTHERAVGEKEKDSQADPTPSTKPDVGLDHLTALRSRPESKSRVTTYLTATTQGPLFGICFFL